MVICQLCGKAFKTGGGLAGHHQWKHAEQAAQQLQQVVQQPQQVAQYAAQQHPKQVVQLAEEDRTKQLEELLGSIFERLDEQLGCIIELLDERLGPHGERVKLAAHRHGMSDPECTGCIEVVRQSLNTVEQNIREEYEATPGVKQLMEIRERIKAEGKDPFDGWTPGAIAAAAHGEPVIVIE